VPSATIERIVLRPSADGPSVDVERVRAVSGRGLEGDRYFLQTGTFWEDGKSGQDITIVAAEALEAAGVTAEEAGRNIVVRGMPDLNGLVGARFRLGAIECYADRLCDPCVTLAKRTRFEVLRALAHRGGIRVDLLADGELAVGDVLTATD
jgi:hypothetical protein